MKIQIPTTDKIKPHIIPKLNFSPNIKQDSKAIINIGNTYVISATKVVLLELLSAL